MKNTIPSSRKYFENLFPGTSIVWKDVYLLPRLVTVNSTLRMFHFKILNNILYLNKKLFIFGKVSSKLCSFCNREDETVIHLFSECSIAKEIWKKLINYFRTGLQLPEITAQSAIFGFLLADRDTFLIKNLILLLFKIHIYESRSSKALFFESVLKKIRATYVLENNVRLTVKRKENF